MVTNRKKEHGMKLNHNIGAKLDLQISPLIDIVFLLLIYFMVTASLIKKEADLSFILPSPSPAGAIDIPVEVLVEIASDGAIEIEGMRFSRNDHSLNEMVKQIAGLKQIAASQHAEFFVNIMPHKEALHRRVIDVMDACTAAGVEKLNFSRSI